MVNIYYVNGTHHDIPDRFSKYLTLDEIKEILPTYLAKGWHLTFTPVRPKETLFVTNLKSVHPTNVTDPKNYLP